MRYLAFFFIILVIALKVNAQNVAITDEDGYSPDAKAMLDIKSANKGLLIPRVALVSSDNPIGISKPDGLLVWNTNSADDYSSVGFYFWNGTDWEKVGSNTTFSNGITQTGNEVKLGGTLNQSTTIIQGDYGMTYNLTGKGDFNIEDNGSSALFVSDNGNIGMGTISPSQKLDILGNLKIGDNLMIEGTSDYGKYRNLATYSSSSKTGAFVINTNQTGNTMFVMKVTGYFYSNSGPYEVTIKGYWTGSSCSYGGYTTVGSDDLLVRIGKNASGAMAVILGDESTSYSHPKFTVTDYYQGYSIPNESYADGWIITQETDLGAFTNIVTIHNSTTIDFSGIQANIDAEDLWDRPGEFIYLKNTNDKVGIGTGLSEPTSRLTVQGNTTGQIDDPLFEVKNNDGNTVFAVYNEGVRIWVKDVPLGTKGAKGGFAVGGFSSGKGETNEFLRVTPDSVRVYIDTDASKAAKGGFAVGGFSSGKAGATDLMRLNIDNYFIGHSSGIKTTGILNTFIGFESGMENTTGYRNIFLGNHAGRDNVSGHNNSFFGDEAGLKNKTGNFNAYIGNQAGAMDINSSYNTYVGYWSGINAGIGGVSDYNTFLGYWSGGWSYSGSYNTFLGFKSGMNNNGGHNNVFVGDQTGINNSIGNYNAFVGSEAGLSNTEGNYNTFLGHKAGKNNTTAGYSTMVGYKAGLTVTTNNYMTAIGYAAGEYAQGGHNVFIGGEAGKQFYTGEYNTCVGMSSGAAAAGTSNSYYGANAGLHNDGDENVAIGRSAGYGANTYAYDKSTSVGAYSGLSQTSGGYNTFIGHSAGRSVTTGARNVFIGYSAGYTQTTINDKLFIDNTSTTLPLIWGDFANDKLRFNGNVGINYPGVANYGLIVDVPDGQTATYGLYVVGDTYTTGVYNSSDKRWKKNIQIFENALEKIKKIRGVTYDWKIDEYPEMKFSKGIQIGVIAQEVEAVIPELVKEDFNGYKSVSYEKLTPILIEAIKEQQKQIEKLQTELFSREKEVDELRTEMEKIKDLQQQLDKINEMLKLKAENN